MIKFIICVNRGPLIFLQEYLNYVSLVDNLLNIVVLHLSCGVIKCASIMALFSLGFYFLTDFLKTILSSSNPNSNIIFQRKIFLFPYMRIYRSNFGRNYITLVQLIHH